MAGPPRRISAWKRTPARPFVLGHRGARRRAPENTLSAFELAMEEGADGVELDVRLSGDGDVIVLHDSDLSRVTSGRDGRKAEDLKHSDLPRTDLGGGEPVPLLADVLRWAEARGAKVNVELKSDVTHRIRFVLSVARLVASHRHAAEWILFSSFDPRLVVALSYLLPWVPTGWLFEKSDYVPRGTGLERLARAAAVHPRHPLVTDETARAWKHAGFALNVWTVNDEAEARRLDKIGVDAIITDEPGKILRALR